MGENSKKRDFTIDNLTAIKKTYTILHFYKNDIPSHPKIASNFDAFGSLSVDVFDSENFLHHQNVSSMSSKLLYGAIALHQSDSGFLK